MKQPLALPAWMEIANLEHRLAALQEKERAFEKQSDMLKRATWITIPVLAAVVVWIAFSTQQDPVPMLVLFSILIPAWAIAAWVYRHSDWSTDFSQFAARNRYTSHRMFLEESIRDCERSLAELKAKP